MLVGIIMHAIVSRCAGEDDTRRKILARAIVLAKLATGELYGKRFRQWLGQSLTCADGRALFELPASPATTSSRTHR